MRILYVASEATPFCASGGLGDVMGSLPSAVAALGDGYEVGVILPLYHSVREKYREVLHARIAFSFVAFLFVSLYQGMSEKGR